MSSSSKYRIAMLLAVALPIITIALAARLSTTPPATPDESQRAALFKGPPVKLVPIAKLRETAIAEVKKREGWTAQADITSEEGDTYYFFLKRNPAQPTVGVQVGVDCVSGKVDSYVNSP
jgi:hypothetical protein